MQIIRRLRSHARAWIAPAALVPVVLIALTAFGAYGAQAQSAPTIMAAQNATLGAIFTDSNGKTLYTFAKDTPGMSNCNGQCAAIWPPLQPPAGALTLPSGVAGALTSITRSDGSQQVTYNGMPLYTFVKDANAGDVTGQGVAGFMVATPQATVPAASTSSTTVHYSAGFNLIGVPAGTALMGANGPLYTFQSGDTAYESVAAGTALQAGEGYWVFFDAPATLTLPAVAPVSQTVQAPAGQYILIGNPSDVAVNVSGADAVFTYDPASGYKAATTLAPGQGAWVLSANGGPITISAVGSQPVAPAASAAATATAMPVPTMTVTPKPAQPATMTMPVPVVTTPVYQPPVMTMPTQAPIMMPYRPIMMPYQPIVMPMQPYVLPMRTMAYPY